MPKEDSVFKKYGPNGRHVALYIQLLKSLSKEELVGIGKVRQINVQQFTEAVNKINPLLPDRNDAYKRAIDAARNALYEQVDGNEKDIAVAIAGVIVFEDRLSAKDIDTLYSPLGYFGSGIIPRCKLQAEDKHEDRAITEFCKLLSMVDDQESYIIDRPDDAGTTGQALCDAIIKRKAELFYLEHTAVVSYKIIVEQKSKRRQKSNIVYDKMYQQYIKPLEEEIRQKVTSRCPGDMVYVAIRLKDFDI